VIRCFKIQRENTRAARQKSSAFESPASYAKPALIIARLAESRLGIKLRIKIALVSFERGMRRARRQARDFSLRSGRYRRRR